MPAEGAHAVIAARGTGRVEAEPRRIADARGVAALVVAALGVAFVVARVRPARGAARDG